MVSALTLPSYGCICKQIEHDPTYEDSNAWARGIIEPGHYGLKRIEDHTFVRRGEQRQSLPITDLLFYQGRGPQQLGRRERAVLRCLPTDTIDIIGNFGWFSVRVGDEKYFVAKHVYKIEHEPTTKCWTPLEWFYGWLIPRGP